MSEPIQQPPIRMLLVEDNVDDIELTTLALQSSHPDHQLAVARDGIEGLAYLRGHGKFEHAVCPDIILLDLNMPRMDGRAMLRELKSDPQLKHIPVVVLTTSDAEGDVSQAYQLHANAYMTKPLEFKRFEQLTRRFVSYWFGIVTLPRGNPAGCPDDQQTATRNRVHKRNSHTPLNGSV